MQFSSTSDQLGIIQEYEFLTNREYGDVSGNATLLDEAVRFANQAVDEIQVEILRSVDGWDFDDLNQTDMAIATANLVANQKAYSLPGDILKIKRLQITYDGTSYYVGEPLDQREVHFAIDDANNSKFSKANPRYDFMGENLKLYPTPDANVTNGLKIWYDRRMTVFADTDTTKEPGIDRNFHQLVPLVMAWKWASVKNVNQVPAIQARMEKKYNELRDWYSRKQDDRQQAIKPLNRKYNWK